MFDISWSEFLLIGVVALVFIGPKELPAVMRTIGQWTRRLRSMAADFQNQFQEAIREAEMADLKKQVDDVTQGVKNYDPFKDVKSDFEVAATAIKTSVESTLVADPAATVVAEPPTTLPSVTDQAPAPPAQGVLAEAAPVQDVPGDQSATAESSAAEAKPDSQGHSG